jgi:hypothetical protein
MSKQSEAKALQGYTTEVRNCGNCVRMVFDMKFPKWIQERIDAGFSGLDKECHKVESGHRCGIGGFAIRKTARCDSWTADTQQEVEA